LALAFVQFLLWPDSLGLLDPDLVWNQLVLTR
jgi:hypothetical protein